MTIKADGRARPVTRRALFAAAAVPLGAAVPRGAAALSGRAVASGAAVPSGAGVAAGAAVPPGTGVQTAMHAGWGATLSRLAAGLGGAGLLRSYTGSDLVGGDGDFDRVHRDCAYTYDNAAAGLALLSSGDVAGATRIGAALAYAQENDRFYKDGRLRNAYRAGAVPASGAMPLSGWWDKAASVWREDAYQASTATGPLAWAMLLWAALGEPFLRNAARAADVIEATQRAARGYSGGFFGFEPAPQKLAWVSTEHNTDLAAAFAAIGRRDAASHARDFVDAMWRAEPACFAMGLRPDGALNTGSALDANLWPQMLPDAAAAWRDAFATVLRTHGLPWGSAARGVDFTTDRAGIWLEGTAYLVPLARRYGEAGLAARCLATLAENTAPDGLIFATVPASLGTGLALTPQSTTADFRYFRRPHLGATAWAVLATGSRSPFAMA